jgi:ribosomal protein S27AE
METDQMLKGQAICKDCGNGTLNNEHNEQFCYGNDLDNSEHSYAVCVRCGSQHIDGELYFEEKEKS